MGFGHDGSRGQGQVDLFQRWLHDELLNGIIACRKYRSNRLKIVNFACVMTNFTEGTTFIAERAGMGSAGTVNISTRLIDHSSMPSTKVCL